MNSSPPNTGILDDWDLLDSSRSSSAPTSIFPSSFYSSDLNHLKNWHITNKYDALSSLELNASSTSNMFNNTSITGITSCTTDPLHDQSQMNV